MVNYNLLKKFQFKEVLFHEIMKNHNQGSLLAQITGPKPAKRGHDKNKDDDMMVEENQNFPIGDNIMSFGSGLEHEGHVKSDSTKKSTMVIDSNTSSDDEHSNSFTFIDKEKSMSNVSAKANKKLELSNKSSAMLVGPSQSFQKTNDDSSVNYGASRLSNFQIGPTNNPREKRSLKQRAITSGVISKPKPREKLSSLVVREETSQNEDQNIDQLPDEKSIPNEDLVKRISEPIRRRLVVNLPTEDFETRHIQVVTALDMVEQDVFNIDNNVRQIHDSIARLSRDSREISEKSMDLTQTSEAVLSKVNVMTDWIDGLEKVGSGLKIQFIEWIVKFVSFLSSLLLLIYQTIRKANPLALLRSKGKKNPPQTGVRDDENS